MPRTATHFSTNTLHKKIHFKWIYAVLLACALLVPVSAHASDNERYKAFPMLGGGTVFIIDTKDGHIWTWTNIGGSNLSSSGNNSQILYRGNVRKNMKQNTTQNKLSPIQIEDQGRINIEVN